MCLLVSLMLLPTAVPAEEEAPAPSVRVLLRRLELTDRADLILSGVYTGITGTGASIAWPRGTGLTVQIRDGELYLFFSGTAVSAGNSVELRRGAFAARIYIGGIIVIYASLIGGHYFFFSLFQIDAACGFRKTERFTPAI